MIKNILLILLFALNAIASLNDVDKAFIFSKNELRNPGFENGKSYWTASAGTFLTTTSSPMVGLVHATWDAAASGNTLSSSVITIPAGMYGRNGVVSCLISVPSGTATHTIQAYDGGTVLSSVAVTSSTTPTRASANFIYPSSGSLYIRLYANADEPQIKIDDCYQGPAEGYNVSSVSETQFIGSAYFARTASCQWSRTSATPGAFTSDADCPGPTIESNPGPGTIQTTDVNLPILTVNNLPPGRYVITVGGNHLSGTSANYPIYSLNDGTTTSGFASSEPTLSEGGPFTLTATFVYTDAGNRSFQLYGSMPTGQLTVIVDTAPLTFHIVRFPLTTEQAYRPDTTANSWSGYHTNACSWSRNNAAYGSFTADATCALTERTNMNFGTVSASGSVLPAITFTPKSAGRYYVCANANVSLGTQPANNQLRLYDGTTTIAESAIQGVGSGSDYRNTTPVCGIYTAASVASVTLELQGRGSSNFIVDSGGADSTLEWSIFQISQNIPAPLLVNSVVNTSSGVTRVESAKLNCDAGSAITSQIGNWISSVGNIASGACAVTLNSGVFSSTPNCTITNTGAVTGDTDSYTMSVVHTSSTSVTMDCRETGGATADCTTFDAVLFCMGAP